MKKYKWTVGKVYSTKEMQALMGISASTWGHKRDIYLDNFALYYEYDVEYDGNKTNYRILKKLDDYKKPPNKRSKEERDKTYSEEIITVVDEGRGQTAAKVSRIIKDHEPIKQFNHKDSTVYEYTRLRMRLMFGTKEGFGGTIGGIIEKQWCYLDHKHNCYNPMNEEQINAFFSCIRKEKDDLTDREAELYNDYEIGLITRAELDTQISTLGFSAFLSAKQRFKADYGFTPIKVPTYGFYDKDLLAFERAERPSKIAA